MNRSTLQIGLAAGWFIVLLLLSVTAWNSQPVIDSSIMAMLPQDRQQPLVQLAQEQLSEHYAERLVLVLEGADDAAVRRQTKHFATELGQLPAVSRTLWRVEHDQLRQQRDFYFPYRFQVLDAQTRAMLLEGLYERTRQRALLQLFSPVGGLGASLVEDPFALWQSLAAQLQADSPVQADRGLLRVPAVTPAYLIIVTLSNSAFNTDLQRQIMPVLQRLEADALLQNVRVLKSGMLLHAAAGADQARSEISTIGAVSVLGILTMTLLVFRRLNSLWLILLPLTVGCLAAVAATVLVFGRIHLITLAFGAGLVGVSVDYALHYLTEQRASRNGTVLSRILPGLTLGLVSSLFAYGAQVLAPFPGLQQMACFSAVGLTAAWLTVVLWYPWLTRRYDQVPISAVSTVSDWLSHWPVLGDRSAQRLLLVLAAVSVLLLWQGTVRDDVRLLQTSPQALLDQEQEVQQLLQQSSMSRFVLIKGTDSDEVLQREEAIVEQLQQLQAQAPGFKFLALTSLVPSSAGQRQNYQAVQQLYQAEAENLYGVLQKGDLLTEAERVLDHSRHRHLSITDWMTAPVSEPMRVQWLELPDGTVASIIRLSGVSEQIVPKLRAMVERDSSVVYVDTVNNLSSLLEHYRNEVMLWVAVAYLMVACVLVGRYRQSSWRVLGPPLVAGLLTTALLSHLGPGLNLFHLLALLLVLGIGLDMGIFLREGAGSRHTWLAVSLSMLTSLLAFGLLVLSRTPVLHHFGLTVLIGLSLVWILSLSIHKTVTLKEQVVEGRTPGTA